MKRISPVAMLVFGAAYLLLDIVVFSNHASIFAVRVILFVADLAWIAIGLWRIMKNREKKLREKQPRSS